MGIKCAARVISEFRKLSPRCDASFVIFAKALSFVRASATVDPEIAADRRYRRSVSRGQARELAYARTAMHGRLISVGMRT